MIIETKYRHRDLVYAMINNKVVLLIIEAIGVDAWVGNINYPISDYIYYNCANNLKEICKIYQSALFPTKETLLQSL